MENRSDELPWESISFACGGWLQFYLYGVGKAIQARGLDHPSVKYCGCSAGALTATALLMNLDFDLTHEFIKKECLPEARGKVSGLFQVKKYLTSYFLNDHLKERLTKPPPKNSIYVAITRLPFFEAELATSFESVDDFVESLLASCAAFPLSTLVFRRGYWCVDGLYTNFQPVLNDKTVTVSPFYFSNCDIKPSRYVPFWWALVPPSSADTVDWLYNLGYEDAMNYFDANGFYNENRARPHLTQAPRSIHTYDTPRRVTVYRFLGYNPRKITNQFISFLLDFILLVALFIIIKPIILWLIYSELFLRVVYHVVVSIYLETILFFILVLKRFFLFKTKEKKRFARCKTVICFIKEHYFCSKQYNKFKECMDCLVCMLSLSLLLRFFQPGVSKDLLRKHHRLVKVSLLYRLFCHVL